MHEIDQAILDGTLTSEQLFAAAREPLPPPGESYWGDAIREGADDPDHAAAIAAHRMFGALSSLRSFGIV